MEAKKEYEYRGIKYKDRKISNTELEQKGVWLDEIEIIPVNGGVKFGRFS